MGNPSERVRERDPGYARGRTTDVAVGLRYTEFPHAPGDPPTPHAAAVYPLFDKAVAEPLFEWTLRQLQAAGFDAPQKTRRGVCHGCKEVHRDKKEAAQDSLGRSICGTVCR